jgi:hypothetical protein
MEFTITWRELLVAVILATLVYLLESALFARRRRPPPPAAPQATDPEVHKLRAEVVTLQRRLDELEVKLGVAEHPGSEDAHAAYDYAVQYARQGMIAPEIAARCGISIDEATLIVAIHQRGREH